MRTTDLDRLSFHTCSNDELGGFMKKVVTVGIKYSITAYLEHDNTIRFTDYSERFETARARRPQSGLGADKRVADNARILAYQNLVAQLRVIISSRLSHDRAEASKKILAAVEVERIIKDRGYKPKTEKFDRLFARLNEPSIKALFEIVPDVEEFILAMKDAHLAFVNVAAEKNTAQSVIRTSLAASIKRPEMLQIIRASLKLISANKDVEGWAPMYNEIRELAEQTILNSRQRRANASARLMRTGSRSEGFAADEDDANANANANANVVMDEGNDGAIVDDGSDGTIVDDGSNYQQPDTLE